MFTDKSNFRTFSISLNLLLALALLVGSAAFPSPARAEKDPDLQVEQMLNPDGTLKLDGAFNGSFDLEGWDVQIDPARGPVFQPAGAPLALTLGDWANLGDGAPVSPNNTVRTVAVSGTDVYVGGSFTNLNNTDALDYIAKWDGADWSALGTNGAGGGSLNSFVHKIVVNGTDIYVGGLFTNVNNNGTVLGAADYIAKWDGAAWSALGSNGAGNGSINTQVLDIAISGANIYAAGQFTDVNNNGAVLGVADYIARWDGANWSALGSNGAGDGSIGSHIYAVASSGSDIYVGGIFTDVNNNGAVLGAADYIAKWDGADWSALGSNGAGSGSLNDNVRTIAVAGTDVYIGGNFTNANNNGTVLGAADRIAKWDGANWSALGSNGSGNGSIGSQVIAIGVSGANVYAVGLFNNVNNNGTSLGAADYIAKWDGANWSALGSNGSGNGAIISNNFLLAITVSGSNVYVGGLFQNVNNNGASLGLSNLALFNGTDWGPVSSSLQGALQNSVTAVAVSGTDVYIGGYFTNANNIPEADYIAKWDGANWSALGSNGSGNGALTDGVTDIAVGGANVYVGGYFNNVNNIPEADFVAKWNGTNWSALGSNGAGNGSITTQILGIAVSGSNLYVGGLFQDVNNNGTVLDAADYIAKWDGADWSALGSNGAGGGSLNGWVEGIAISGSDIYVIGVFTDVNNNGTVLGAADYIAKWDGANWSSLGSNGAGDGSINAFLYAIAVSGSNVYVGGNILGGVNNNGTFLGAADYIAKWDGANWSALGSNGAGDGSLTMSPYAVGPKRYKLEA